MGIDYQDLKEKLWEVLPKGENKDEAVSELAEGLSGEGKKRYNKAMEIYSDYKKFKKDLQGAIVFGPYGDDGSNAFKLSLRNTNVTKTLLGMLNESYKLASSEINSMKSFVERWADNTAYATRTATKTAFGIFGGGEDKAVTEFDNLVVNPIKKLCKVANNFKTPDKKMDEKKVLEIKSIALKNVVEELKETQASLLKYVNHTMEKLPDESVLNNMPGTQVFLRILLGLSGIKRKGGKPIEESIKDNSQKYKKYLSLLGINGGGLLALMTVYTINSYGLPYGFDPQKHQPNKKLYDKVESEKWKKLDSVREKYEK